MRIRLLVSQLREALVVALGQEYYRIDYIEYGPKDIIENPTNSMYNYVRIKYMTVFNQPKFRITSVYNGVEGSGHYIDAIEPLVAIDDVIDYAMNLVIHYHRDTFGRDNTHNLKYSFLKPTENPRNLGWWCRKDTPLNVIEKP